MTPLFKAPELTSKSTEGLDPKTGGGVLGGGLGGGGQGGQGQREGGNCIR